MTANERWVVRCLLGMLLVLLPLVAATLVLVDTYLLRHL